MFPFTIIHPCVKQAGTCNQHRGHPLISWHSWAPWGCNNWKDSSWEATTPRERHREQTEATPVFPWKRPIYLVWNFTLRDWLQVSHIFSNQGDTILAHTWPCYSSTKLPRKELIHSSGAPILALVTRKHLKIS